MNTPGVNIGLNETSVFNNMYELVLTRSVAYKPVCPYLFRYASITSLEIDGQVDSFMYVNLLRFTEPEVHSSSLLSSINSSIVYVKISGYNYKLDSGLLDPLVFERAQSIVLVNTIAFIQADVFKSFQALYKISLQLDSVGNFYHQVGIDWLNHMSHSSQRAGRSKLNGKNEKNKK
jgi:hypothetical protein